MADAEISRAVDVLRSGGVVAFPTETVYGLGADASDPVGVDRIFRIKGRPAGHPLIVHLGDVSQLADWAVDVPPEAYLLARNFWPGPLTMIVKRSKRVVDAVTGGRETVGLRVPDHPVALEMLRSFGGGVAAPSANRFGKVSPTTADHVRADLGDEVDYVLDGGPCSVGVESTIVDLTTGAPEVLRPGGVSAAQLAAVLGRPVVHWIGQRAVAAPGTLTSHYSPAATVEIVASDDVLARSAELAATGCKVGLLAPDEVMDLPAEVVVLDPAGEPEDFARVLYRRLREADALGLDILLVIEPESAGVGTAVIDRIRRAASVDSPR